MLKAGNEAVGLYVRCGTYAADHTTDGFVERSIVILYGTEALAARLVDAGLWHRTRGGWNMHDYLDYNPSREAVEKERKDKADRQKRWREKQGRRVTNASSDASGDGAPTRPAPKEAGRASPDPGARPAARAIPSGPPSGRADNKSVAEALAVGVNGHASPDGYERGPELARKLLADRKPP